MLLTAIALPVHTAGDNTELLNQPKGLTICRCHCPHVAKPGVGGEKMLRETLAASVAGYDEPKRLAEIDAHVGMVFKLFLRCTDGDSDN